MAAHPYSRRRKDVDPDQWTRWKVEQVRRSRPWMTVKVMAEAVGIPRNAVYDWLAGRRRFGRLRRDRLDRWCRPLLAEDYAKLTPLPEDKPWSS